jgi:hypothetical protein
VAQPETLIRMTLTIRHGPANTLAWDLSANCAYGAGTGITFWLLTRIV